MLIFLFNEFTPLYVHYPWDTKYDAEAVQNSVRPSNNGLRTLNVGISGIRDTKYDAEAVQNSVRPSNNGHRTLNVDISGIRDTKYDAEGPRIVGILSIMPFVHEISVIQRSSPYLCVNSLSSIYQTTFMLL